MDAKKIQAWLESVSIESEDLEEICYAIANDMAEDANCKGMLAQVEFMIQHCGGFDCAVRTLEEALGLKASLLSSSGTNEVPAKHKLTINFGERGPNPVETFEFNTEGELDAFLLGMNMAEGWDGFEIVED